ncbi:MAG: hypothetical protein LQ338_001347 [Usnochroma carphineum]|nr:MAG: hypothetical protein LQ338_001347 [Usnochroma carphineum]
MDSSATSTTVDPLSLSLRAWPPPDSTAESLPYLIARINEQKGSFRNVTEASLEEEVRAAEAGELQENVDTETKDNVEDGRDVKAKGDELAKAREEIIKQVGAAYTASSHALDFVSLLLSKHASKAAEATISPYVKQTVPLGSLDAEMMQGSSRTEAEKANEELVGLGWRLQSLTRSADTLLKSASRLEQEMEQETTYWQQILLVKKEGWSLCRMPGEPHTLGVRFGFPEAHAQFRDRGLAALRRDSDGNIRLDRGFRWQGDKRLRVRLLGKEKPIATSSQPAAPDDEDRPLTELLTRARNSLFDEELQHELNREARNLVNQGVRCVGNAIRFPLGEDSEVEVDIVSIDEEDEQLERNSIVPTAIAMSLRILLSHAHRENLNRRSQPPAPISDTPVPRRIYSLLRPILEIDRHDSAIKAAQNLLDNLKRTFSAACLPFSAEESSSSLITSSLLDLDNPSRRQKGSTLESLISRLTQPHHASITFHLPSNRTTLKLDIHTTFFPPTFGTTFHLSTLASILDSAVADMPQTLRFPTIEKLSKHLFSILALDIVSHLRESENENESIGSSGWMQASPYQAELIRKSSAKEQKKDRIAVVVDGRGLHVECTHHGRSTSARDTWPPDDAYTDAERRQPRPGLLDFLTEQLELDWVEADT